MIQLCGVLIILGLVGGIVALANKNGKQAARLKELKRELESIERAQKLANDIGNWDADAIRSRLHEISNRQQH
jgi:hypothetical protein